MSMTSPSRSWPTRGATAVLLSLALARFAPADTRLYLGEYKFNDPRVYAMGPGGADLEELAIVPTADWLLVGIQVDAAHGHIYWTHGSSGAGRIRRANLDGTDMVTLVQGLTNARGLAIDPVGGWMYWSDTQDNRLYRAHLDGTGVETIVDTGHQLGHPTLDVAGGKVYFGNFGAGDVRRANLDGTEAEVLFGGLFTPIAIALDLDAGKIYWADSNTSFVSNHIARANLDGTEREILYEGLPTSSGFTGIGLDLDAGRLYWCDEITAEEKGVWESSLDGTGAHRIFASPEGWNAGCLAVVVDGAAPCPADLDDDGAVGVGDLLIILAGWGTETGDVTGDGTTDVADLLAALSTWGAC